MLYQISGNYQISVIKQLKKLLSLKEQPPSQGPLLFVPSLASGDE